MQLLRRLKKSLFVGVIRKFPPQLTLAAGLLALILAPATAEATKATKAIPAIVAFILSTAQHQASGIVGNVACAASANATGHMICVYAVSGGQLMAFSTVVSTTTITADTQGFSPGTGAQEGLQNPLPLISTTGTIGVAATGTVGPSSCANTADASGDVICAYNSNPNAMGVGSLMGVRFSILDNTQTVSLQTLGVSGITGNPSCSAGAPRLQIDQPMTVAPTETGEGTAGEVVCAFRSSNGALMGVGFNPALNATSALTAVQNLGVTATGDPSCSNPPDAASTANESNQVVCAFVTSSGIQGVAFDPRTPTPFLSSPQTIAAGSFGGNPGCATASIPSIKFQSTAAGTNADSTGDLLCAIVTTSNTLQGFRFNPRKTADLKLLALGGSAEGSPSCSGLNDGTNEIFCSVRSTSGVTQSVEFDPKSGASTGLSAASGAPTAAGDLSCTFQNVNPDQVACGGVLSGSNPAGEFFGVIF